MRAGDEIFHSVLKAASCGEMGPYCFYSADTCLADNRSAVFSSKKGNLGGDLNRGCGGAGDDGGTGKRTIEGEGDGGTIGEGEIRE